MVNPIPAGCAAFLNSPHTPDLSVALIIAGVLLGFVIAIVIAPFLIYAHRKKLRQMESLITEHHARTFHNAEEQERARQVLMKKLIAVKSGIANADKASTETARDLIASI